MPAFRYQAIDVDGELRRGVVQAETARSARSSLRERGLTPVQVESASTETDVGERAAVKPIPASALALLSRQLATLIRSGVPVEEALHSLQEGADDRSRWVVARIRARVMEGASLATAMGEQMGSFPDYFRAAVAAGEASGRLDLVLQRLADHQQARHVFGQRVLVATAYPALLALLAVLIVLGLMIWVVPGITDVFEQQGQQLPWATRLLMAVSAVIRTHAVALVVSVVICMLLLLSASRLPRVRRAWHRSQLRLPVVGSLIRAAESARAARSLAVLVSSAVPLLDALGMSARTIGNLHLRESLQDVAKRVREGQSFARALAQTGQFPPIATRLIIAGEKSGRLGEMLQEVSSHQEHLLETRLAMATAVLGPIVILLVGALVLFIVLAILMPIFDLNTLVR